MAFPTGWTRKCALVIQHGQVPANQTAFPVLITAACLPAEMVTSGGTNAAQADGGDIRFSSDVAGASQLACEIVIWTQNATPASAVAEIWVPVNVLTASDVTIYVWYKAGGGQTQPAANAAFGSQAVWGSNYKAVYHMGDGVSVSTCLVDSTGNQNLTDGASPVLVAAAGKIGGSAQAPTGNRYYVFASLPALTGASAFSWSLWANVTGLGSSGSSALFSRSTNFASDILLGCNATQVVAQVNNGADGSGTYNSDIRNVWHMLSLVFDGTQTGNANRLKVYDQAVQQTLSIGYTVPASTATGATGQDINAYTVSVTDWSGTGYFDEVRVNAVALSANWIATEYNNQNSPGTFILAGTPGSGGGGVVVGSVTCSILISGGGGGSSALTCSIGIGYGGLSTSCGAPQAATVGVGGFVYRPPVTMGSLNLTPIYDLNHTLTWEVSALPPGLRWDGDPSSSTYGHIVGTPTLAGTFFYAYTVSSPDGQRISNSCALIVNPGAPGTGPYSIVSCSIIIAPADGSGPPCPPDAIGGPG